jgi:hypothetical protein
MLRTTLSICALFGSLIVVSKWLHETSQPAAPVAAPVANEIPIVPAESSREPSTSSPQAARPSQASVHRDGAVRLVAFEEDELADVLQRLRGDFNLQQRRDNRRRAAESPESAPRPAARPDAEVPGAIPTGEDEEAQAGQASGSKTDSQIPIVLTPELIELRGKIRECLAYYYFRPENVATRSPWGAMHAMIAYGVDSELIVGSRRVNAIGYLCYNGTCSGQQLFALRDGEMEVRIGPGLQGHPGQFLAMLAQSRVKTEFPIKIEGQEFTVADLIEYEKETCRPATELTFKLIALTHYCKSDEKWKSNDGQDWDIPRLIKEELKQPIIGATCGGAHRLTGFSYAVRKREQRGEPFDGQWLRAKTFIDDYHEYAFKLQNPDGSFSTDWFAGRADMGPPGKRLETTGHISEWLIYSLPKEQLVEPRMVKSVDYLTNLLLEGKREKWSIGPLGHGLHALAMYDERVFGGQPGKRAVQLAEVRKQRRDER